MRFLEFSMWESDEKRTLSWALSLFSFEQEPAWRLLYIEFIGASPDGMPVTSFENLVRQSVDGYAMTSEQLAQLADGIRDLNEIELKGVIDGNVVIELKALDSTLWKASYDEVAVRYVEPSDEQRRRSIALGPLPCLRGASRPLKN